jgi:thiosulfate/3-mercaptopyruvate sulfurtransferase
LIDYRIFRKNGIDEGVQVVSYDDTGGAMASARLWWLLRWLGMSAVAVLDGGWQAWLEAGFPVFSSHESSSTSSFIPKPRPELIADAQEVFRISVQSAANLFDARSADRFRGENEIIDPVAGHIPGAETSLTRITWTRQGGFGLETDYAGNISISHLRRDFSKLCFTAVQGNSLP